MRALLVPADETKPAEIIDLDTALRSVQDHVGGYIQILPIGEDAVLICNEDGKVIGLPMNRRASIRYGFRIGDLLVGDVLITGAADADGDLTDISDTELQGVLA